MRGDVSEAFIHVFFASFVVESEVKNVKMWNANVFHICQGEICVLPVPKVDGHVVADESGPLQSLTQLTENHMHFVSFSSGSRGVSNSSIIPIQTSEVRSPIRALTIPKVFHYFYDL